MHKCSPCLISYGKFLILYDFYNCDCVTKNLKFSYSDNFQYVLFFHWQEVHNFPLQRCFGQNFLDPNNVRGYKIPSHCPVYWETGQDVYFTGKNQYLHPPRSTPHARLASIFFLTGWNLKSDPPDKCSSFFSKFDITKIWNLTFL